ncbi:MAG: thioredoxin family protein [Planctomycetota bacterium]
MKKLPGIQIAASVFAVSAFAALLLIVTGRQVASTTEQSVSQDEPVPYMSLEDFATTLAATTRAATTRVATKQAATTEAATTEAATTRAHENEVLLVEFCLPSGCPSCDAMREPIDHLASDQHDLLTVRRVDLRKHPQLAWELGFNEYPTYIAFRNGEEVFRATYPTSAELIVSGLGESLRQSSADDIAIAAR